MPHKTKENRKRYRERNKERILQRQREWYANHPEKVKEYEQRRDKKHRAEWARQYRAANKEQVRANARAAAYNRYITARMAVIEALGKCCNICGFDDFRALEVHHLLKNGNKERINRMGTRVNDYRYYRQMLTHLEDYQLLCSNCHSILNWNEKHPDAPVLDKEDILVFRNLELV